jgi:site-specific DNA recombinase
MVEGCMPRVHAPKIKRIFELYAYQPLTLESLIDALARQGIVYTDRHPKFDKSVLYRILTNRHYIGEVRFLKEWHPGKFKPLVDRATFQAVQERFRKKTCRKAELVFAGRLIRCGHCGHLFTGETKLKRSPDGSTREYTYYFCTHYTKPGHPRVRLTEAEVDGQFLELFDRMRIDEGVRDWIVEVIKAKVHGGQEQNRQHRVELERQRVQVEAKLKTLLELRVDGEITAEDFAIKRAELHDRQAGLRLQLETTDHDDREIADLAIKALELSQSLKNRWKSADFATKRTILEILCESAESNREKLEIRLRKPFDLIASGDLVSVSGAKETRTPNP